LLATMLVTERSPWEWIEGVANAVARLLKLW
jgi:hypothetical protein